MRLQATDTAVAEPVVKTMAWRTVLVGLAYVVVFVLALVALRTWVFRQSEKYAFGCALMLLLLLGFLSPRAFVDALGKWTQRSSEALVAAVEKPSAPTNSRVGASEASGTAAPK